MYSQTHLDISARISLVLNYVPEKLLWKYFEIFFIFFSFTARTEKIISWDLMGIIRKFKQ